MFQHLTWKRAALGCVLAYGGSLAWRSIHPQPRPPRVRFTEVAPVPSSTAERVEVADRIAAKYDSFVARAESGAVNVHRKLLLAHARGRVLEVAVGTGRNFELYPAAAASPAAPAAGVDSVEAVDASAKMIEQARVKYQALVSGTAAEPAADPVSSTAVSTRTAPALRSPSSPSAASTRAPPVVRFSQMDASALQFPDGSFDTVVDTLGLCSVEDPSAVLRELVRVTRKDGRGRILLLEHGRYDNEYGLLSAVANLLQGWGARRHCQSWGCDANRDMVALVESHSISKSADETGQAGCGLQIVEKRSFAWGSMHSWVLRVTPPPSKEGETKRTPASV